jgi:hypothetical protein
MCLQAKLNRYRYLGLLAPLPIPKGAWQVVLLDFIEELPLSGQGILVVVDKFSKYGHFLALKHPLTTIVIVQTFFS